MLGMTTTANALTTGVKEISEALGSVAHYITDNSVENLIAQMDSMSLDTRHDFSTDRFRIYALASINEVIKKPKEYLQRLIKHISMLASRFKLVVVDSVSPFMTYLEPVAKIDFLQACKELGE